jgi:hypothetical protein
MARKQITFSFIALLIICGLSSNVKGQTSELGPKEFFNQYLPLISVTSPYDVYLKSYSEYIEGTNHYVVGELMNQTNTMFYDGGVTVEIKGQNYEQSYRSIRTFIRCLNPHQTTPFKVVFNGLSEPAKVSHISWSYGSSPEYPPCQTAQVVSQNYHDDYGTSFYISISNINPKPMYGLTIAITLLDSSGKVVGVEKNTFPQYFPPNYDGINGPIESISTSYRADQFSSFSAQAEGFTSEGNTFP